MLPIKPRIIENIVVFLFVISYIGLAIYSVNIDDIPRMCIALTALIITLIPYAVEKLLKISLPFGVKIMISWALFMHTAGGIMRWYWMYGQPYHQIAHIIAGFAVGLVIFCCFLYYILYSNHEIAKKSVLIWTGLAAMFLGVFWESLESTMDYFLLTMYNEGGLPAITGQVIGNIIGIIICLYVIKRWMDSVPPQKSISCLLRKDQ